LAQALILFPERSEAKRNRGISSAYSYSLASCLAQHFGYFLAGKTDYREIPRLRFAALGKSGFGDDRNSAAKYPASK
jgi:hypothetical protein